MDEDDYNRFKKYDIGDIVGVEGEVFRTQRGEMSVRAKTVTLLSKSLLPLPEKFHGLTDKETRYRQRYVDLIVNPEVKRNFVIRSQFIKHLRNYLDDMGYIEVETPVLNTIAGGAAARPFITHHNTLDIDMYMRIATELPLKRLIVGGMDRVYEVGRIFRNEGMDPKHNPEFTTVELYQAYADFHDMMDIAEGVLHHRRARRSSARYELEWMGEKIDLTPGWPPADHGRSRQEVCGRRLRRHHRRRGGRGRGEGRRRRAGGRRREDLGQRAVRLLRPEGRGASGPADLHHHVPGGGQPADQAQPGRPAPDGALRVLHLPQRDGQRLFRAERPHRPARALR